VKLEFDVTAIKGGFEDKIKKAFKLGDDESVEFGWFDEQGDHPNTNGQMTYAELALYHATGGNGSGKVVARPVLDIAMAMYPPGANKELMPILIAWLKDPSQGNTELMFSNFGKDYVEKIKGLFGSSYLHPTSSNPDPLIDSGALREHTAHKNSLSNTVKTES
jgi:hypothetical protein